MKRSLTLLSAALLSTLSLSAAVEFETATPEEVGVQSGAIANFVDELQKLNYVHSFVLLKDGKLVAEGYWAPYDAETPHALYSLSKSFTSMAIGLAIQDGELTLEDRIADIFPEESAEISEKYRSVTVRDLLTMRSGHAPGIEVDSMDSDDWVRNFFSQEPNGEPGETFAYNNGATYMLSAIFRKVTGETVHNRLKRDVFEPLGFEETTWETCPQGTPQGFSGLSVRTRELARFGQLLLDKGVADGKQLLPADYIAEATSMQVPADPVYINPLSSWGQGYGYQFWRCPYDNFRGDGAYGQYCLVMESENAVLAINSGVPDMQAPMEIIWKTLYAGLRTKPFAANPDGDKKLEEKLKTLQLPVISATVTANEENKVLAQPSEPQPLGFYNLGPNAEGFTMLLLAKLNDKELELKLFNTDPAKEIVVSCGFDSWKKNPESKYAGSYFWDESGDLLIRALKYNQPRGMDLRMSFHGDYITVSGKTIPVGPSLVLTGVRRDPEK